MKIHPIKSDSSVIQNIEYKKEIKSLKKQLFFISD